MDEKKYTYGVVRAVFLASAILFVLLIIVMVHEAGSREWRDHQKDFRSILEAMDARESVDIDIETGILQVELPQFNRDDRCISCHLGLEDHRLDNAPQPHTAHPGSFLIDHPMQQYGCTMCHGGQGQALDKEAAFGHSPDIHWPYPLLEQPYLQASCGKCHLAIFDGELEGEMEGMDVFRRGKDLFAREGCLGCHKARGTGGILGPDLTRQGEKTKHEYSFRNVRGEQSISNWLMEHFKDPEMVSPGSQMLQINLEEEEYEALAVFVMGLSRPEIPFEYFSMPALMEFKGIRDTLTGEGGFERLCSACHGKNGEGKDYEEYETGIPSVGNTDFLRVASEDFIRFTIEKGRSLRQMGSWNYSISGMKAFELDGIAGFLDESISTDIPASAYRSGDQGKGLELFGQHCELCHGEKGTGGVALALNQEGFLTVADASFIVETIYRGRGNTAMPAWPDLSGEEVSNLVTAIRSWGSTDPSLPDINLPPGDPEKGATQFHFMCFRCHGEFGEGDTGPSIINRDFLAVAGDAYLYTTIAKGRAHTAMFGWSSDVYNEEKLDRSDISNIISFMRQSAREPMTYLYPGSNPGDRQNGELLFSRHCAECHGKSGEGVKAPALNNQEFLSAATNGYLLATITLGRNKTDMPSWGYGSGDYPRLEGNDRSDIVAHIRSWQRIRIKY